MNSRSISLLCLSLILIGGIIGLFIFREKISDLSNFDKMIVTLIFFIPILCGLECTWKEFHFYHKFNAVAALVYIIFCLWVLYRTFVNIEFSKTGILLVVLLGIVSIFLANHSFKST